MSNRSKAQILALVAVLAAAYAGRSWIEVPQVAAQITAPAPTLTPWTAIGASGTVDESSIQHFAFTQASAGYNPLSTLLNFLEFRYNVTNTYDNNTALGPNVPGWTRLELGASAPGQSVVDATLYRVRRCNGEQQIICQVRVADALKTCRTCTFANNAINFTNDLYYVRVAVDRATVGEVPLVHTLRIF